MISYITFLTITHYCKVKCLSKNLILTKPQHFHEFFTQFFLTIFLVKSKLSTAKKSKTTTIFTSFSPKKIDSFLGKSKLNFWTKNEDFEQCAQTVLIFYFRHFDRERETTSQTMLESTTFIYH